ncbi:hypothetical protein ACFFV7_35635 [Nonomuraea spiralis]|uniref:ABC transporter permease n=1 Tax=Nonomuraea spiralis TaxID=46182 RepID=A0ABV5IPY0_9ACTN|nr:hypothetical protein [Nonomuraea spiralis]GGT31914.1 hypothetical protein GCM10010176_090660 [Nonomuraea spiralis]
MSLAPRTSHDPDALEPETLEGGASVRPLRALAAAEALRLMLHPLAITGLALYLLTLATLEWAPRPAYSALTNGLVLPWGVPVFFAAALTASASRRAGADEMLAATPVGRELRTAASCLAGLGPFLLACAVQAILAGVYTLADVELERFPSVYEIGAGPLCVLGACLLGVAVARWLPWPGAPVLVMLVLVTVSRVVEPVDSSLTLLGFYVEFALWGPPPYLEGVGFIFGSPAWHALYLLALGLGAGALAMTRDSRRRWVWLGLGAALVVLATVAGLRQLP